MDSKSSTGCRGDFPDLCSITCERSYSEQIYSHYRFVANKTFLRTTIAKTYIKSNLIDFDGFKSMKYYPEN